MNRLRNYASRGMLFFLFAGTLGCGTSTDSNENDENITGLVKVQLALNWLPEIEHGGFYAAKLNGTYEAAGLDVEIFPGGPDAPVIERVGSKRVTFGLSNADRIVLGRAAGADVVALMAPLQDSPRCIMVHQTSGIQDFEDLNSITLAMSEKAAFSHFLRNRFELKDVRIVPYGGSVAQFLVNDDFAQQGYVFSEPILAANEGSDPKVLMVSDTGFNPYSSVVITHGDTIEEQSDVVRKFVAASKKGWQDYLTNPKRINEHIHSLNSEIDLKVLNAGMESLSELCKLAGGDQPYQSMGTMNNERWTQMIDQLVEIGLVDDGQVEPESTFTLEFLKPSE